MDEVLKQFNLNRKALDFRCPRKVRDKIAELIADSSWYLVGRSLIDDVSSVNSIRDDHLNRPSQEIKAVSVLDAWDEEQGSKATCLKLAEALYDQHKRSALELLCDEVKKRKLAESAPSMDTDVSLQLSQCNQQGKVYPVLSGIHDRTRNWSHPNDLESVNCVQELVHSKPRLSFPLLDLKKMDPEEKELLHQRLFSETEDMTYKFQQLFNETRQSLVERKISSDSLLDCLDLLAIEPTFKGSKLPVLGCQLQELREKTESVAKAMSTISSYCSFFNYRIVEKIINNLGTEQDKTNLKNYQEEFRVYAQHHIFECPSELGEMREIGHANMFVTLDVMYESYTVSHLYAFVSNLQRVLKMPAVSLRLCRIGPGSLKMTFQMPHSVQRAIFPLSTEQEEVLRGLGVVHLSCGDYQFTRHDDEKVVDSAQADGDSDLTDSEGSADGKNTCDAELATLDDRLATVKLGDGFSTADSGLGSSSVASVTTAGVTQSSEDLIEREFRAFDIGMGCDTTQGSHFRKNKLHRASYRGDLDEVKRLVEEKQLNPFEKCGKSGANAIHYAAKGGHLKVVKYYAERGYYPASELSGGWNCLHIAAYYNHYNLVQYLVSELGMDTMWQTIAGFTPLHLACVGGGPSVVIYLINAMSQHPPIIGDILRCKGQGRLSPLHVAALNGKLEIVDLLITKFNSNPLMTDDAGRIALHHTAQEGHLRIVKFFVEQMKCDPSHMDKDQVTPLHLAAMKGHLGIVKYLTQEQHCDALCVNKHNDTPLHLAAGEGHLKVVKFFIETLHCPHDITGHMNMTPLQYAYINSHVEVVKYLKSSRLSRINE